MPFSADIKVDLSGLLNIENKSPSEIDTIFKKVAFDTELDIKQHFSSQSPSEPGEPPGVDTGALKNSINTTREGWAHYTVHDGVEYGVWLEYGTHDEDNNVIMEPRPFMLPAKERILQSLASGSDLIPDSIKDMD